MYSGGTFDPPVLDYPFFVEFNLESFEGPRWLYWRLLNLSGWMRFIEARLASPLGLLRRTLIVGCSDEGVALPKWQVNGILPLVCSHPQETSWLPPGELEEFTEMERWDFMGECDLLALQEIEELESKAETKLHAAEARVGAALRDAHNYISGLRREARSPACTLERRRWIRNRIETVEEQEALAGVALRNRLSDIRAEVRRRENALWRSLRLEAEVETLCTVQFSVRNRLHEKQVRFPLIQEEIFSAGVSEQSAQAVLAEYLEEAPKRRKERKRKQIEAKAEQAEQQRQRKQAAAEKKKPSNKVRQIRLVPPRMPDSSRPAPKPIEQKAAQISEIMPTLTPEPANEVEQKNEDATVVLLEKAVAEPRPILEKPADRKPEMPIKLDPVDRLRRLGPARAEQVERLCKARRLTSPKSRKALSKLKQGKTTLDDADRNALKHLLHNLQKTGFDVEGFLNVR